MNRKAIALFFSFVLVLMLALPIFADGTITTKNADGSTVIYNADGSRTVTSPIYTVGQDQTDGTKASGSVTRSISSIQYESDGSLAWRFTLTATFTYTGTTAFCTSASYSKTIYNSAWSFSNGSATRSANTATGKGTFTKKVLGITTQTIPVNLTLTCDENGNVY